MSPGQIAQLRALERKYAQRLYTLQHPGAESTSTLHEPTEAELAELRAMLEGDILGFLTPEQTRLRERR